MKKLSILIPVYNEINNIEKCLEKVKKNKIEKFEYEIIVSDNNSTDGTRDLIKNLQNQNDNKNIIFLFRNQNEGKGANIINAIQNCSGDIAIIQDSDLEYDPIEYESLIKPIIDGNADVVYGTRFSRAKEFHVYSLIHLYANSIITFLTNIFYNKSFSDVLTGYKVFKIDILRQLNLKSKGYDIETEITSKLCKIKNIRIYEVPISVYSRTYKEGKKIHWWHLFILILSLLKHRIT
jgi:glycosyltransferase involved in cell wall biosynthesis